MNKAEMKCCVPNCDNIASKKTNENSSDDRITFHKFPKDPNQRSAWIAALAQPQWVPSSSVVCSNHFKDTELYDTKQGVRRIKIGAVPVADGDPDTPIADRVCKICLCLDAKMYHVREYNLDEMYLNVLGMPPRIDEWLPQNICWECAARLYAADSFREKAMLADAVLTGESLNLDDLLKIHETHPSFKSTLTIQKVFTTQLSDDELPNSLVKPTNIPHNHDFQIKVDGFVKGTKSFGDNDNNEDFEQDSDTSEVDLVSNTENGSESTKDEISQQDSEEYTDTEDIKESIDIEEETYYDDSEFEAKHSPIACVEEEKNSEDLNKKPVKRSAAREGDDYSTLFNTRRYRGIPIDEKVFKITQLNQEYLMLEVERRKDSDKYKKADYKCGVCYLVFRSKEKQDRHAIRHSVKSGPLKCVVCKCRMKLAKNLREHMKEAHCYEYSCKLCHLVTRSKTVALGHMRFHAGKTYKCPQCPLEFDKSTTFLSHQRLKHMSDCVCELCGYTFISQNGVRAHKTKIHKFEVQNTVLEGPHCEVCDVKFLSQNAYDRHLRLSSKHIQSEDDPFRLSNDPSTKFRRTNKTTNESVTCEQCGLKCGSITGYTKHFRRDHRGMKRTQHLPAPCMCEHCGKSFATKIILDRHKLVHTNSRSSPKRYECDHCHKGYSIKWGLQNHMILKHLPINQSYECRVCNKLFAYKNNLNRHMNIHTTLEPVVCVLCDKQFPTSESLRQHVHHVHLNKPWPKKKRPKK